MDNWLRWCQFKIARIRNQSENPKYNPGTQNRIQNIIQESKVTRAFWDFDVYVDTIKTNTYSVVGLI